MFHRLMLIVAVTAFTLPALAQERFKQPTEMEIKAAEAAKAREAEAKALLAKPIPVAQFVNVSFVDAIDQLRDLSSANIFVNWRALENVGVLKDRLINIRIRQVSTAKVLGLLLSEVSDGKSLTWILDDGVIYISSVEDINRKVQIKIYEVRDLLDPRNPDAKGMILTMIITDSISPNSWLDKGGTGTIKYFDGKLVITQTYENHLAIQNLFDGLRAMRE